ncbi:NAD(P)-binding domain-containing protein [Euzebya tangerina]|uniref:NAD(P)-binding domain-containing protein n=1 Tax=Euzebya tangerina TaxID=591198 RepID=UPI000E318EAC|nr:NAD(P)-binding domain-containing protein [Euzebya tangerina]
MERLQVEVAVIGAGQAGLAAGYWLRQRDLPSSRFVILDGNDGAGGAWQHRWPTLTMATVNGIHDLPGFALDDVDPAARASDVIAGYFTQYEHRFDLPVRRPVRVREVHDEGRWLRLDSPSLTVHARALLNATGTWTRPFWPAYPGRDTFEGRQLHSATYDGPASFAGQHVIVVGGGISALQHLAEISEVAETTWVTRRPPEWFEGPLTPERGRQVVAAVAARVESGRRPASVVSVTGLPANSQHAVQARRNGALVRREMFQRLTPTGAVWADGSTQAADTIVWATGFRHALDHLAPLGLRTASGGIVMADNLASRSQVAADPRIHLLGYGPSASTVGASRAAREAVVAVLDLLDGDRLAAEG